MVLLDRFFFFFFFGWTNSSKRIS